ncbi:hypothetical protein TUM4445_19580 [Shewanella sp. MBTL60-112-B2]|nr:hypothetical protein TUM4444_15980 [Shewanella sp. MBTL60-112-B1]GIU33059.1 hypothetical protein TUM4445_19580 [Shewanella sp. MBTL60-112-B2]
MGRKRDLRLLVNFGALGSFYQFFAEKYEYSQIFVVQNNNNIIELSAKQKAFTQVKAFYLKR